MSTCNCEMTEKTFLTGAATAPHQVEGNNTNSDCWVMEHVKHSDYAEPSGDACDHYHRYEEDIRCMAEAGLNAYRFGIEWARIEPRMGEIDRAEVAHYRKVIECCEHYGITPVVTLMHFSSPAWLMAKGGWGKPFAAKAFARYAKFIAKQYRGHLPYICTINEANMGLQLQKIMVDMKPQNRKEGDVQVGASMELDMKKIFLGMVEQGIALKTNPLAIGAFLRPRSEKKEQYVMQAHTLARDAIRKVSPETKVGLTLSLFDYQVQPGGEEHAEKLWQEDYGFYLPYIMKDDFLGVQNYSRKLVDAGGALPPAADARLTQMGYEDYPSSIGHVLQKVAKSFPGPLMVTENGIATSDDARRCEFIREAYASVKEAQEAGVPVLGYLHWSLLDNFEWQAGYAKTFGLIAVDRATRTRYPKDSLKLLGELAKGQDKSIS